MYSFCHCVVFSATLVVVAQEEVSSLTQTWRLSASICTLLRPHADVSVDRKLECTLDALWASCAEKMSRLFHKLGVNRERDLWRFNLFRLSGVVGFLQDSGLRTEVVRRRLFLLLFSHFSVDLALRFGSFSSYWQTKLWPFFFFGRIYSIKIICTDCVKKHTQQSITDPLLYWTVGMKSHHTSSFLTFLIHQESQSSLAN